MVQLDVPPRIFCRHLHEGNKSRKGYSPGFTQGPGPARRHSLSHGHAHVPDRAPVAGPLCYRQVLYYLLTVTTIIGIFLAIFIHQRAWCSICPIGSLSSWVGANRCQFKMARDSCVSCGLCAKNCPMQLKPNALKEQPAMEFKGDCLKCGFCVKGCPKQALELGEG